MFCWGFGGREGLPLVSKLICVMSTAVKLISLLISLCLVIGDIHCERGHSKPVKVSLFINNAATNERTVHLFYGN